MIYLLYGSDTRRSIQKLNEITEEYRKKAGADFNLHRFDAEEDGLEKIRQALETGSLFAPHLLSADKSLRGAQPAKGAGFAPKKLVVIKYPSLSPKPDELRELLEGEKNYPNVLVVLWDRELGTKELAAIRALCQKTQEFKEAKIKLPEESVFRLGDTFFSNRRVALWSLLGLLGQGHDEFGLFSYLSNHARTLMTIKHYEDGRMPVPSKHGIHPFVIKKAAKIVSALEGRELRSAMCRFFEEDFRIKTGVTKPRESLFSLLLDESREP